MSSARSDGFLQAFLDFTFTQFVTIRVIAVLYGLALAGVALATLGVLTFTWQGIGFFAALVVTPLFFFLSLLMVRMYLEITVVLFRIADNTTALRNMGQHMLDQSEAASTTSTQP